MAVSAIVIDKLNSSNYSSWSSDMKFILLERNGWDLVEGTETLPVIDDKGTYTEKDVQDFKKRQKIALSLIYLYLEPEYRIIVEECRDPKESWEKLRSHFYPDTRALHMILFSEFCNCRINPDEKVDMFAARLHKIYERLRKLDSTFSQKYLVFQLLRYLPQELESISQVLLRVPDESFVYTKVLMELVAEETRIALKNQDLESQSIIVNATFKRRSDRFRNRTNLFQV